MFSGAPRSSDASSGRLADAVSHAQRVPAVEERPDERFVDDHDGRRVRPQVVVVEITAIHDRDAHGREVARIDDVAVSICASPPAAGHEPIAKVRSARAVTIARGWPIGRREGAPSAPSDRGTSRSSRSAVTPGHSAGRCRAVRRARSGRFALIDGGCRADSDSAGCARTGRHRPAARARAPSAERQGRSPGPTLGRRHGRGPRSSRPSPATIGARGTRSAGTLANSDAGERRDAGRERQHTKIGRQVEHDRRPDQSET